MMSANEGPVEVKAPELANPDLANPDVVSPNLVSPNLVSPDLVSAAGGSEDPDRAFEGRVHPGDDLRRSGTPLSDAHLRPVEDLHNLLLRISHHLDFETSERTTIYHRLRALDEQTRKIAKQTKRRRLRALARFLTAILIGVGATLAWQAYGDQAKQVVATRAPDLGWSPQSKEMIAGFVQELGLTRDSAAPVQAALTPTPQAAPVSDARSAPAAPAVDPEEIHDLVLTITAMRQNLDQIATGQEQMAREIVRLQNANAEILAKMPAPARPPATEPGRKPISATTPGSSRAGQAR